MGIEKYISDLLYRYDCIVLPNLGAFISHYQPAQIHAINHTFRPPSKSIQFNTQIDTNDGILANYISQSESISFKNAQTKVDQYVRILKNNLKHKKEAIIPKLGILHLDVSGHISFEANLKENYLTDSFGLETIQSPAILRNTKNKSITRTIYRDKKNHEEKHKYINWKVAAVLIPLIAMSSFLSLKKEIIQISYANYAYLNPFKVKPEAIYVPRSLKENKSLIITNKNNTIQNIKSNVEIIKETSVGSKEKIINLTKKSNTISSIKISNQFHLIAGSFSSKKNAINLSKKLEIEGYKSSLIGQSDEGLYRVAYQSFSERKIAVIELEKLKKSGKSTWLLKQ